MKTKNVVIAVVLTLGMAVSAWARYIPIGPGVPLSDVRVGHQTGQKWDRKTVAIPGSIVQVGVWYRGCPAMPGKLFTKAGKVEVTLTNGKKITLGCKDCRKTVEEDLKKYEPYMYN